MNVLIADLDEHAPRVCQESACHYESITEVCQERVNAQFPGVPKCPHLFRLSSRIFRLAIPHVPIPRTHLPVRPKLDPIGWVEVDALDLSLQPFLLRQARHDQQG